MRHSVVLCEYLLSVRLVGDGSPTNVNWPFLQPMYHPRYRGVLLQRPRSSLESKFDPRCQWRFLSARRVGMGVLVPSFVIKHGIRRPKILSSVASAVQVSSYRVLLDGVCLIGCRNWRESKGLSQRAASICGELYPVLQWV